MTQSLSRIFLSKPHMGGDEQALVNQVFETNMVAPVGPMLDRFEQALIDYTGIEHGAALASGTAALHLAMIMLKVGPGDQVWTPSMTFMGGVSGLVVQGATPVFFDNAPDTWCLDAELLADELAAARLGKRLPKAIIATDLYGQSCDLDAVIALCAEYGVPLVTDSAEALGTRYKDRQAGKGALMTVLSFNGNKIITTSGGGALMSDDPDLIAHAKKLATQARDPAPFYQHSELGYNYRLSGVCAAIGVGQMQVLEQRISQRRAVYQRYKDELKALPISFVPDQPDQRQTHWLSVCLLDRHDPEALRQHLEQVNVEARPVWKPMHMQPLFAEARFVSSQQNPICARQFGKGLCLPSCSQLAEEEPAELDRVIERIRQFSW